MSTATFNARIGRVQSLVAAVPVWGWLAILLIVSVVFRFVLSLRVHAPWVFQDEMVYGDLARSLGETGHFAIRDVQGTNGFGPLYPALIAPAWAVFGAPTKAYVAAKFINAILMSLAAIPTYVIARRLMRPSLAVLAAAFAVAIPSLAYTNTLLSENAFYPAVMAAAAALFLLLERPTVSRVGSFLLFTLAAVLVRAQGVTLVAALALAILIAVLASSWDRWPRPRAAARELLRYWLPLVSVGACVVLVVLYELARGRPVKTILGTSSGVTSMQHPFLPTLRWTVHHLGEFDLYLGIIPFVALLVIAVFGLRPGASRELRAFAAASVALIAVFVATASIYATDPTGNRLEERYMFHVAPLFFVALLAWIELGLPRPIGVAGPAAAAGAGLAALVPYDQLITTDVVHDAFALVPLFSLELRGTITPHSVGAFVGVLAVVGAALTLVVSPRRGWVLIAVVLAYYAVIEVRPIENRIADASRSAIGAGIGGRRDWVDRRVGPDANVALLMYGRANPLPLWENEFFNRSVRKLYTLSGPYDSLPRTDVAPRPNGVLQDSAGRASKARFVLADDQLRPAGKLLARDRATGMALYETSSPLRLRAKLDGLYTDRWSGPEAAYTQYGCRGGTIRARVLSDPVLYHRGLQTITVVMGGKTIGQSTVPTTRPATVTARLPRHAEVCAVGFVVSPTAVPAQVSPGNGDTRTLGIRFLRFDYRPARG